MAMGGCFSRRRSRLGTPSGKSRVGGKACGALPPLGRKQALALMRTAAPHKSRVVSMDNIKGGIPSAGMAKQKCSGRDGLSRVEAILTYVFARYVALSARTMHPPPEEAFLDAVLRLWGEWVSRQQVRRTVRTAKLY